jgi:hypothetical protein
MPDGVADSLCAARPASDSGGSVFESLLNGNLPVTPCT